MHLPTTLTSASTSSLLLLAALASQTTATCYPKGFQFGELGGTFAPSADVPHVLDAINRFCHKVDGSVYYRNTPSWKACADMPAVSPERGGKRPDCGAQCLKDCLSGMGTGFAGSTEECRTRCGVDNKCDALARSVNHVEFEIRHDSPENEAYMADFGSCREALYREVSGCREGSGSYNSWQGFWYRIDPNPGVCGGSRGEII